MAHIVPLTTEDKKPLTFNKSWLNLIANELKEFSESTEFSNSPSFPNETLFTFELKNNNAIEGYYEDLSSIIKIINNPYIGHNKTKLDKEYQRIINLYKGYEYILTHNEINKQNLNDLYNILSVNLLDEDEILKEGQFYRDDDVFIYFSDNLSIPPDLGFDKDNIERHMNELFEYINSSNTSSKEEEFFKSQIIHFYMVYIHPYFDINGRTSRTTSLWYLNNKEVYPYTIFNRAITYNKRDYYKIIREVRSHRNLTPFIDFVARGTKKELEKEYVIRSIENNSNEKLTPIDKQLLQYILSNNSLNTLIDLQKIYNRFNPKCSLKTLNEELLEPLFEKGILLKKENTSKQIYSGKHNYLFEFNKDNLDFDKSKIKRLNISKII